MKLMNENQIETFLNEITSNDSWIKFCSAIFGSNIVKQLWQKKSFNAFWNNFNLKRNFVEEFLNKFFWTVLDWNQWKTYFKQVF